MSGHAAAENASRSSAVMVAGVGNRSMSARNQSDLWIGVEKGPR